MRVARTPPVPDDHPLIGTWITAEEDSDVAFVFRAPGSEFHVTGFCRSDGEPLSFAARFPSTDTYTKNVFRVRPDGKADLELTVREIWKKKDVEPGSPSEAWRRAESS